MGQLGSISLMIHLVVLVIGKVYSVLRKLLKG